MSAAESAKTINSRGGRAYPYQCDVTKPEEMKALAASIYREHGTVDVVVANAGQQSSCVARVRTGVCS